MSSVLDLTKKPNAPIARRLSKKITLAQKRWLLAIHLLFVAAWIGGGLGALAVNLAVLNTTDPHLLSAAYVFADTLEKTIIRGGAGGTLLTGILLALLTQWGLVRFYWVIVTELISILIVAVDFIIIGWNTRVIALTLQGLQAFSNPTYLTNRTLLFGGIFLQLALLVTVLVINIFKPWGPRKRQVNAEFDNLSGN